MNRVPNDVIHIIINSLEDIVDIFRLIIADKYIYSMFSSTICDYDGVKINIKGDPPQGLIEFYNMNMIKIGKLAVHKKYSVGPRYYNDFYQVV